MIAAVVLINTERGRIAETAEALHLSIHTVRNYLRRAMAKLDAHTRLEAVLQAVAAGLIELPR